MSEKDFKMLGLGASLRRASIHRSILRVAPDEERGRYRLDLKGHSYLTKVDTHHAPPVIR